MSQEARPGFGATRPPSGEQVAISHGDQRAVVVTVGGGLREYTAGGVEVLDGYAVDAICDGGRGQLLVPWPNRLRAGRYTWRGRDLQVALSEPERSNAIHGLARWMPWSVVERGPAGCSLQLELPAQPGYPFQLLLDVSYRLDAAGLTVTVGATNVGREACPYGAGAHPYITVGTELVDDTLLQVPAERRLVVDERQIPVASEVVVGTAFDFRQPRRIGDSVLDVAYGDLERDAGGFARATVAAPDGRSVELWVDANHPYLMVFTGDTLAPERRRRSVAIEPMTCAPNAFQSGDGLRTLEPGETFSAMWGITPRSAG
jgi:aldose 1-epimerase